MFFQRTTAFTRQMAEISPFSATELSRCFVTLSVWGKEGDPVDETLVFEYETMYRA
jgi:hypothetical protein